MRDASSSPTSWLSFRLAVLSNRLALRATRHLSETDGLLLTEWRVLALIGSEGPTTVSAIAARAAIDKSWISRSVRRLISRGLVRSESDGRDLRKTLVTLTRAGKIVYERGAAASAERNAAVLSALTPGERVVLFELLTRLDAKVDELEAADAALIPTLRSVA